MDTRKKIVPAEAVIADCFSYSLVLATFDVLTASRIQRLREIRSQSESVVVAVSDVPGSLLPAEARAQLAASLAMIDRVVITEDYGALHDHAAMVFDEREAETQRTADLIRHVHQRNQV